MRLHETEWAVLLERLREAKSGTLDAQGAQEMRFLLSKQSPRAPTMTLQELIDLARLAIGWHEVEKLAYGEGAGVAA